MSVYGSTQRTASEKAEQLGISCTPRARSFSDPVGEELIELQMNRGTIVKSIGEKFITDHYKIRALLESEVAARAAALGLPECKALLQKLKSLLERISDVTAEVYEVLNLAVHTVIWTAAT